MFTVAPSIAGDAVAQPFDNIEIVVGVQDVPAIASVPKTSRNKNAAWDYIMWYASPENSLGDVVTSGSGINPYRYSHFSVIDKWTEAFSPRVDDKR